MSHTYNMTFLAQSNTDFLFFIFFQLIQRSVTYHHTTVQPTNITREKIMQKKKKEGKKIKRETETRNGLHILTPPPPNNSQTAVN